MPTAQTEHPNLVKMRAAVARWIAEAADRTNGAQLLRDKAGLADVWLWQLGASPHAPSHLVGLDAFDLRWAIDELTAAAVAMRTGPDTWDWTHAEAEDRERAGAFSIALRIDGEPPVLTTLGAFMADNEFDQVEMRDLCRAVWRRETYVGGGGASPVWTVERTEPCGVVTRRAA